MRLLLTPTSARELENLFEALGLVADVKIPADRETGQQRPFAFVTMTTAEAALAAIRNQPAIYVSFHSGWPILER